MTTTAASHRVAIKNVLVMTDLSPASDVALRYAAGWARRLGATIHLVHFIRPMSYAMAGDAYGALMERLWQQGREGLAAIEGSDTLRDVPHATHLDPGEILDGLAALILAHDIDLVVLASAGRRGLEKVLLGSTAEAVFRSVSCPVLILGPTVVPSDGLRDPRAILFATDFGPAAERAAEMAFSLAQESQARLYLLHVLPAPSGECAPCLADVERAEARLRAISPAGAERWCEPEPEVKFGRPADEIVKTAHARQADLIVLGARRPPKFTIYGGWANAYQVLSEAPCPVLTVRE